MFVHDAGLAVLADGMGGYNAGEVASGIAVKLITEGLLPELVSGPRPVERGRCPFCGLTHAAMLLRQPDRRRQQRDLTKPRSNRPECAGMGTTVVAAVFHGNRVFDRPHRRFALLPVARRQVRAS